MDKNKQEEIKSEIKKLIETVNDKNANKEEQLKALDLLNALMELNIEFIKKIKNELKN